MKIKLVGKQIVSYTKKGTGELKEGISFFYTAPKPEVQGECSDSLWITRSSTLYEKMVGLDLSKPIYVDALYEMYPGARYATLVDIKIL